jgi:nucleoside-diphosphate-sugar epimerase
MNVLITGSTGAVGSYIIPVLYNNGHQILELTRDIQKSETLFGNKTKKLLISDDQEALTSSINDFKPEVVIHLAAYITSADNYDEGLKLVDANITYLFRLLDALKSSGIKFFINTGTFAEYFSGNGELEPAYLYAATKTAARSLVDYYAKAYQFTNVNVIPYTIYGGLDKQRKIIDFIYESLSSEEALDLTPGGQLLDFIHIDDVVSFFVTLIENYRKVPIKTTFHLGTGTGHTLKDVAGVIEEVTNKKTNINWGGRNYRPTDVMYAIAVTDLQIEFLQWKPSIDLEHGIELYLSSRKESPL